MSDQKTVTATRITRKLKRLCSTCVCRVHSRHLRVVVMLLSFIWMMHMFGMLGTLFNMSGNWRIYGLFYVKNYRLFKSCTGCFRNDFDYIITNDHICKQAYPEQRIDLFIVILTSHGNWRARHAIRNSWLTISKNNTSNVRYAFLLGDAKQEKLQRIIVRENRMHRDFVQENFMDSYLNLTYKTIMGLKLAVKKCGNASYILKTDDDVYVNVKPLLNILQLNGGMLHKAVGGHRFEYEVAVRDKNSKWYVSSENFAGYYYPDFCSGTGYVTSMHVARAIYEVSPNVPFFHLEDVYVGMCLAHLGYRTEYIPGFMADNSSFELCDYKRGDVITVHRVSPVLVHSIWNEKC